MLIGNTHCSLQTVAAIEIGSGDMRVAVASISEGNSGKRIEERYYGKQTEMGFSAKVIQNENKFSEELFKETLAVLNEYKQDALKYNPDRIFGVATDIFRKAVNGSEFIDRLSQELGFPIEIIDQDREGAYGFYTACHAVSRFTTPIMPHTLIAWDSGNSSVQLTAIGWDNKLIVYKNSFGMAWVKNALDDFRAETSQEMVKPISLAEMDWLVGHIIANSPKPSSELQEIIKLGIVVRKYGKFLKQVYQLDENRVLTKEELRSMMESVSDKTALEISEQLGIDESMSEKAVLSMVQTYAIMQLFELEFIRFARTKLGNTTGILLA